MVTLTEGAVSAIRGLAQQVEDAPTGGLRIADGGGGALQLGVVQGPEPGDAVVDAGGAKLFLDETAERTLDGKALDARPDGNGQLLFTVGELA